jgi:hypothetical protein
MSSAPVAIAFAANNGSLPPPYRRSTEISVDADGRGVYTRRLGYDRTDPTQAHTREFQLSPEIRDAFANWVSESGVLDRKWRETPRPTVGGSQATLTLECAGRCARIPAQPIAAQRALAVEAIARVRALVPESIESERKAWEAQRGEGD